MRRGLNRGPEDVGSIGTLRRTRRRAAARISSTGRLRVAHLTTVDISLRYLIFPQMLAVIEEGGEVTGISAPGRWVSDLEQAGVRHIALSSSTRSMNLAADVRSALELWRILRRERFDVLHTHTPKPGVYGRILGRLAGTPVVVNTVHGLYATEDDPLLRRVAVYFFEALAARFSDAELVQNREDLALMQRLRIAPRGRALLLGNGVDLVRFAPGRFTAEERAAVRAELGAGPEDIVVGTVGRLVAEKGFPELFDAISGLDQRYHLIVAGPEDPEKPDALAPDLMAAARANGVQFLGMRTDVDVLYAAMDVFVLASHREGLPRAAMEAAASGLPVVATDIRGCREVVEHGINGFLVPVGDPAGLAAAIRSAGDDPDVRRRMGEAGRQRALAQFDERRIVQTVMETYHRVAGPPFPRRPDRDR